MSMSNTEKAVKDIRRKTRRKFSTEEKIRRKKYGTRADARQAIFEYIEMLYNPKRRHAHNGRVATTK